jgi:CRP/FNR family transcriptional regulator
MHLEDFVNAQPVRKYERGQVILLKDDTPTKVAAIKSGFVKGHDIDALGNEQLLWVGLPGDIFPSSWALGIWDSVEYFFTAFSDVELYVFDRYKFTDFLETSHVGLMEFTTSVVGRVADTFRHLNAAEKARAEEKIIHTLHFLSIRYGKSYPTGEREIKVPLTHQDIANLLGLTRETVAGELKKLKARGVIDYDKSHFLIQQHKLEELL